MLKKKQSTIIFAVALVIFFSICLAWFVGSRQVSYIPRAQQGEAPGQAIKRGAPFKVASIFSSAVNSTGAEAGSKAPTETNVRLPGIQMYQSDVFTGSATISYPIETPAGAGGLAPNISLNYSSSSIENLRLADADEWDTESANNQSEAGDIGLGWSLSGIGGVHRDAQTGQWSLSLNGSHYKLLEVKRERLAYNQTYEGNTCKVENGCIIASFRPENDAFLKIIHVRPKYGTDFELDGGTAEITNGIYQSRLPANCPPSDPRCQYTSKVSYKEFARLVSAHYLTEYDTHPWHVWDKSGTKYTFGLEFNKSEGKSNSYFIRRDDGNQPPIWYSLWYYYPLKEIRDLYGNKINFAYTAEFKELDSACSDPNPAIENHHFYPRKTRVSTISYNGGKTEVKFLVPDQSDREDYKDVVRQTDPCHQTIWSEKRISEIQIVSNGALVRKYKLVPTHQAGGNYLVRTGISGGGTARFLGLDSIELWDNSAAARQFEVRSKFEYYDFLTGDLMLKKAGNVTADNISLASVEYLYNNKTSGDRFFVFDENEKLIADADQNFPPSSHYRSVKEKIVSYITNGSNRESIRYTFEYPALTMNIGGLVTNYSFVIQAGEGKAKPPGQQGAVYSGLEFKGHPRAIVIQYKKGSTTEKETITEYVYNLGIQYQAKNRDEHGTVRDVNYHSFYPFAGSPKRVIIRVPDGTVKSVSETDYKAYLPFTQTEFAGLPAKCGNGCPDYDHCGSDCPTSSMVCSKGLFVNPSTRDYKAYQVAVDQSWWGLKDKIDGTTNYCNFYLYLRNNETGFGYTSETRSCALDGVKGIGAKTTSDSERGRQLDAANNGQQYGNMTGGTTYYASGCTIDTNQANLVNPGISVISFENLNPSASSYQTYKVFDQEGKYIVRSIGSESFVCPEGKSCDEPTKRASLSWNIYDESRCPWDNSVDKNQLKRTVAFYTFPENKSSSYEGSSYQTIESETEYENTYGLPISGSSFADYGSISFTNGTGGFLNCANWTLTRPSDKRTTKTAYYQNGALGPYAINVTNPLGQTARTTYDFETGRGNLGLPVITQDANGARAVMVYDSFGRVLRTCSPLEVDGDQCPEAGATVKYQYFYGDANRGVPYVVETAKRDDQAEGSVSYLYSWSLYNGLGQLVQAQVEKEADAAKVTVVDTAYNGLGSVEKGSLPYLAESGGNYKLPTWVSGTKQYIYDSLGRKKEEINPDGTKVYYDYMTEEKGYGPVKPDGQREQFVGSITQITSDTNQWNNHLIKRSITDPLGRLVQVEENITKNVLGQIDEANKYVTTYQYDSKGLLTDIYDAKNQKANPDYHTHITYNQAGQKVEINDPDLGIWKYGPYNAQGSLLKTIDPRRGGIEKHLEYDKLNRLTKRYYTGDIVPLPQGADQNQVVSYTPVALFYETYDDGSTCNYGVGRLCLVKHQYGNSAYAYDLKGRVLRETIRYNLSSVGLAPLYTYNTRYEYDSMDRVKRVTFGTSDAFDVVSYRYNDAGQLVKVQGQEENYEYLKNAAYNVMGLPVEEDYGNNTKAYYKYFGEDSGDPLNFRLKEIEVAKNSGNVTRETINCQDSSNPAELLRICYRYDNIGNIINQTYPLMSGTSSQPGAGSSSRREVAYSYDNLNRLLGSTVTPDNTGGSTYGSGYDYDSVGKITRKCEGDQELTFAYTGYPVHAPKQVQTQAPAGGRCQINTPASSAGQSGQSNQQPKPTSKPANLFNQVIEFFR
ncbi:hypothetical protein FJY90_01480 [Candidatus Gottesmanbacteria bacterium]|nr:hypothetical protein [Candidatus Gottesmanbacteria bacterium]